jgi:hypothetical protein
VGTSKSGSCSTRRTETDVGEVQGIVGKRKKTLTLKVALYTMLFFLKYAGEMCIISLIEEKKQNKQIQLHPAPKTVFRLHSCRKP